jgi:nucleoid DNA-binding protein
MAQKICKDGLTRLLAKKLGSNHKDAIWIFDNFVATLRECLQKEVDVSVRNFGTFEVRKYKERKCRNPKTGEIFFSPPKKKIHFKAGKFLKEKVCE